MSLKLQLVRNGDVIFEIPLSPEDWSKEQLENELEAFETSFERLSKIFDALSHKTRLRMMKRLLEDEDQTVTFVDFMRDLELNPKIVWESTRKLREGGLLEKIGKGKYRCSIFGEVEFMLSLALRRMIETLEELENLHGR